MTNFIKYPSIGKFNDVLKTVQKNNKRTFSHLEIGEDGTKIPVFNQQVLPKLTFQGTVKLHGTNGAVILNSDLTVDAQSRNRILTLDNDNHGFCQWVSSKGNVFLDKYGDIINTSDVHSLHIYGEWCGSNIQSNVGLMGIEKTFVVFGILQTNVDGTEKWLSNKDVKFISDKDNNIRNIFEFTTFNVQVDMNSPQEGLDQIDIIRDQIDKVCPVAKALGSDSDCEFGEGNVWRCVTEGYTHLSFKHKGENHTRSGKKPKQQKLDEPLNEQQQEAYDNFMGIAITVDRLAQGLEFLQEQGLEIHRKSTGKYLKWVSEDVIKECKDEIETLSKLDVQWKKVIKPVSEMSKEFLFSEIDKI